MSCILHVLRFVSEFFCAYLVVITCLLFKYVILRNWIQLEFLFVGLVSLGLKCELSILLYLATCKTLMLRFLF